MRLSRGRFGPHHCPFYSANAFLGPDLGSFAEYLTSFVPASTSLGSFAMDLVHHPFYYPLLLGLPFSFFYAWLSAVLLRRGILDPASGENDHSTMYTWILSTGWRKNRAPINPDAVVIVGFLCSSLFAGFIYINRLKNGKSIIKRSDQSLRLILVIVALYCIWCASQIYWREIILTPEINCPSNGDSTLGHQKTITGMG